MNKTPRSGASFLIFGLDRRLGRSGQAGVEDVHHPDRVLPAQVLRRLAPLQSLRHRPRRRPADWRDDAGRRRPAAHLLERPRPLLAGALPLGSRRDVLGPGDDDRDNDHSVDV